MATEVYCAECLDSLPIIVVNLYELLLYLRNKWVNVSYGITVETELCRK